MKKKIISIMLTLVMLCSFVPCIAMAEEVASGECGDSVVWTLDDDGTLTISGSGDMYISLRNELLNYKEDIKKIIVGSGIIYADFYKLSGCNLLTEIEISDTVTEIEFPNDYFNALTNINVSADNAVYSSKEGILLDKDGHALIQYPAGRTDKTYTIPDGITAIKNGAFYKAAHLEKVVIPGFVTEISPAFGACGNLTEIEVAADNENYCSEDGILFNKAKNKIISYPAGKIEKSYNIPETVTEIDGAAFFGSGLETIVIPDTVKKINYSAFLECTSLVNVALPEGLENIGTSVFAECSSLKSMTIPKSITVLSISLFEGCTSLENVVLPERMTKIEGDSFYGCTSLESIVLPESITEIGEDAFYGCAALKSISIPEGVTLICEYAFANCSSLASITLPNSIEKIYGNAFDRCYDLENVYYNGTQEEWENLCDNGDIDESGNSYLVRYADIHYDAKPVINGTPKILPADNTYAITVPLKNVLVDCRLIAVLYDEYGIMQGINAEEISLNSETKDISVSGENADEIKIFIWDSLSGAKPLCKIYSEKIVKE